ncbi:TlpA disulfide reductase family protein, partial [Chloroflexota bacterium]
LGDLMGKPVLLNFWATWCPPCRSEMPLLQEIYEGWSDKGLVLLAIDIGEHPTQVRKFLETHNLSIPVLLDTNGEVAQKFSSTGLPIRSPRETVCPLRSCS